MTIKYDSFGAPITETIHEPMVSHYPRTLEQPAEISVSCTCGDWEFFSQESAGGGLEAYGDDWQDHLDEAERAENGGDES